MESIYPELALCGSKNECARTDTVFFPISQVCTRGVTLIIELIAFYKNAIKILLIGGITKMEMWLVLFRTFTIVHC